MKKGKTNAEMAREHETRLGEGWCEQPQKGGHCRRENIVERTAKERRNNEVTQTPPRKGTRGRKKKYYYKQI